MRVVKLFVFSHDSSKICQAGCRGVFLISEGQFCKCFTVRCTTKGLRMM